MIFTTSWETYFRTIPLHQIYGKPSRPNIFQNSFHKELYDFIHSLEAPPIPFIFQKKISLFTKQTNKWIFQMFWKLNQYFHPPPLPKVPTIVPRTNTNSIQETNIITWNASSLTIVLPNLQNLVNNSLFLTV